MQARGGLVEHEEDRSPRLEILAQERGQLDALALAAAERAAALPEVDVRQAHIDQRLEPLCDALRQRVALAAEEFDGLLDAQVQHVVDVFAAVFHFQDVGLEALAAAGLADHLHVGHELHRDVDHAFAQTLGAAAAVDVEREVRVPVAVHLRVGLLGEQAADVVIHLQVGHGIGARALADGVLVDIFDGGDLAQVAPEFLEDARLAADLVDVAVQGGVEDVAHQRTLAAAAHARHDGHTAKREAHVDVLQVVLAGADHFHGILPAPLLRRDGNLPRARQIVERQRTGAVAQPVGDLALEDHAAAVLAGQRPDVDELVGRLDDVAVVFHHDDGVAQVAQAFEHADQPLRVAFVQADAGLVENVHRAHQVVAQAADQVDALAFAAAERVRGPVEGEVAQAHVADVLQPGADLPQRPLGDRPVVVVKLERIEKCREVADGHRHQFVDVLAAHLHVEGLGPEARAAAGVAGGLARVAAEHIFVLDLVALALDPFEERVDAGEPGVALPEHALLFGRELDVGLVDREVEFGGVHDELFVELFHHLAAPAGHGALVDAQGGVGDHERLVDADGLAVTAAHRAGAQRTVVAEQVFGGLFEADAVGFEQVREIARARLRLPDADQAAALGEGGLHGVERAAHGVLVVRHGEPVDEQQPFAAEVLDMLQGFLHLGILSFAVGDAGEAFFLEVQELFDLALFLPADVGQDQGRGAFLQGDDVVHHVLGRVAAHFPAGDRGIGLADPGEEQAQVIVDLGGGADRGARVPGVDFLLDGDGRRNAADQVDVGLVHPPEELPGERREALREAALPFGEQRVEGQRTLAAAGNAGEHHQFSQRNVDRQVLQVVNPGAAYVDLLCLHLGVFRFWVSSGLRSSGRDSCRAGGRRSGSSRGGS